MGTPIVLTLLVSLVPLLGERGEAWGHLGTFVPLVGWHWMNTLIGDGGSVVIWGGR